MRPNVSRLAASSCLAVAMLGVFPAYGLAEPVKLASPTVEKYVLEDGTGKWQTMADACVGDVVPCRVVGTLPERLDLYDSYRYVFVDTSEDALSVDVSTVKVSVLHEDGSEASDVTSLFDVSFDAGVLRVGCEDLRSALPNVSEKDSIVVDYDAKLMPGASTGFGDTNDNFCHIEHTRQKVVDSSELSAPVMAATPGGSVVTDDSVTTTDAKASVATYALRVKKVDAGSGKALEGASFTLSDSQGRHLLSDGTWSEGGEAATFTSDSGGTLTMPGLDTGDYVLTETKAPSGYDVTSPVKVTITGDVATTDKRLSASADGADVVAIDASAGVVSAEVKDGESAGSSTPAGGGTSHASMSSPGATRSLSPVGSSSAGGGALSKTGDFLMSAAPVVGVGAIMLVLGLALRRVRRHEA